MFNFTFIFPKVTSISPVLQLMHALAVAKKGRLFLELKAKLEVREDELSEARSNYNSGGPEPRTREQGLANRDKELFEALRRQGILEERSSEYDQLRSALTLGRRKLTN
jgi:hypothetical protein